MATAEKQLLIRLVARADGQPVIAGFGRTLGELASSENRLQTEIRETNAEARRQSTLFGELAGSTRRWLGVLAGTAGLGFLAKQTFDYNQELEGTQIAIAGLLFANSKYTDSLGRVVDRETAFQAANLESIALIEELQRASLQTAATVPQIADAFAIVYGALNQAGIQIEKSAVIQLTTRLTQTANAMKIPMDQIRQEINSLVTGQVTEDSVLARRIGLDNASIRRMQANGTLVGEIMRRTDGYARAAEAQADTVRGKLVNTSEAIIATFSRALDPVLQKSKGALDWIFKFFEANGDRIVTFVERVVAGAETVIDSIGKWIAKHRELAEEILAIGAVVGVAAAAYGAIGVAIAALTSPVTIAIGGIVALAHTWERARKYSEIEVGGRPIAAYVRATMQIVATAWIGGIAAQIGAVRTLWFAAKAIFGGLADVMLAPIHFVVAQINRVLESIPPNVAKLIPGFDSLKLVAGEIQNRLSSAFKPVENAKSAIESATEAASVLSELTQIGIENAGAALESKGALGGVADLVKDAWNGAADWLEGKLPELSALGKKAAAALVLTSTVAAGGSAADANAAARAAKAAEALQRDKDEYLRFVNDYREEARAAGDPLSQALAKIQADRQDALTKLGAQRAKLKDAISADVFASDENAIKKVFGRHQAEARLKAFEGVKNDIIATLRLQNELTLQGKELQDAVERYVRVFLDAADIREKINAPFDDKLKVAATYGQTRPLARLDDISAAIDAAVERMAGLTDIEDIVAAQEEINRLSRQYYETQLQYLARIQQVQDSIAISIAAQREQIRLAGMNDQEKANFFFDRMVILRGQLEASTDPEEISRLTQQIQQYVSQALGLAPDNEEMRNKLLAILGDVETIANGQLAKARKEVEERDAKPASALERAAELLMKAATDLSDTTKPKSPDPNPKPKPADPDPHRPARPGTVRANQYEPMPVMVELIGKLEELTAGREVAASPAQLRAEQVIADLRAAAKTAPEQQRPGPDDYAKALREALQGIELRAVDEIVVDNGDLGESVVQIAERRVLARLRDDPDAAVPRAA